MIQPKKLVPQRLVCYGHCFHYRSKHKEHHMPLIKDRASIEKTIKDILLLMTQNEWDLAFDKFDLLDPITFVQHLDLLIDNFNPFFFNTYSAAFVKAIAKKLEVNPSENFLEKPWFKKLVLIPEIVKEFNVQKNENQENLPFLQIVDAFNCILAAKVTSHFFNIFSRQCKYKGFEFNLEYSYHQTFEPIFEQFRHEFFVSKNTLSAQPKIASQKSSIQTLTVLTSFAPPLLRESHDKQKESRKMQETKLGFMIQTEEIKLEIKLMELKTKTLKTATEPHKAQVHFYP